MWVNPDLVHVQSSPHNYTGRGGGEENTQRLLLRPAREAGMAEVGKTELERSRCTAPVWLLSRPAAQTVVVLSGDLMA